MVFDSPSPSPSLSPSPSSSYSPNFFGKKTIIFEERYKFLLKEIPKKNAFVLPAPRMKCEDRERILLV